MSEDMKPRCSAHDCDLILVQGIWDCPIAALHDLADQFEDLYGRLFPSATAGENGVYHHARNVVSATLASGGVVGDLGPILGHGDVHSSSCGEGPNHEGPCR